MRNAVIYIHGQGGNAAESEHYISLFPDSEVIGFDYHSQNPWDACREFSEYLSEMQTRYDHIRIIANSIGAYFTLHAFNSTCDIKIDEAFFISPIVDMEKLISDMMMWAGVTEAKLEEKGTIETSFGETLSWDYLSWVRTHPVSWSIPTAILYGSTDHLQSIDTISEFAEKISARLTVMEGGEHWFHTEEQMQFLDAWIRRNSVKTSS